MKYIYVIIFFLFFKYSFAIEKYCQFEEVYSNGEIQLGYILIKNDKIRYEYQNQDLYTIIYKAEKYFLIQNNNKKIIQKINQNTEILDSIIDILKRFPNIKAQYSFENLSVKIEKSNNNFIKRLGIQSDQTNLSINFIYCSDKKIDDKYFNQFNLFEFNALNVN